MKYRTMLLDMIDNGEVNKRDLCKRLINWMSEDEVKEFMEDYDLDQRPTWTSSSGE
jgi:hypothetical protein